MAKKPKQDEQTEIVSVSAPAPSESPAPPYIDALSGIEIPSSLAVAPVADFAPNPWNPNKMDDFMREKLARSIRKDGFLIPVLVRPNPTGKTKWEIVDGEHRLIEGRDTLKMSVIPYLNLGPISDSRAKQVTIKANTLRGEFDSVQLGKMIADMVNEDGFAEIALDLPYTAERLQGLVDLVNVDMNLTAPTGPMTGDDKDKDKDPPGAGEFKSFDPSGMKFDVKCPRCGFEHNLPKAEAATSDK